MILKLPSRYALQIALLTAPLLLLMPAFYYSLTTPFSLIDDYIYGDDLANFLIFKDADRFSNWLHRNFLSSEISRFRPFWELANGFALTVYGTQPSLHHLSRWVLHLASVAMFVLAWTTVMRPKRRSKGGAKAWRFKYSPALLMPIALMAHIWLFFPNSPVSRLQPQEIQTVLFLGLCNWMVALMLVEPAATSLVRAGLARTLLCLGCLGLSWSKEVNVGFAASFLLFQLALLLWRRRRIGLEIAISLLLFAIVVFAASRVYVASRYAGVGYGEDFTASVLWANVKPIAGGLLQGRTSAPITASFIGLGLALAFFAIKRLRERGLDGQLFFLALLLIQGAAMFLALCSSYDVALRYWYPLIPLLSTAMAFAAYFLIGAAARRSEATARTVEMCLSVFIVFYIACNYSNFLFQTISQHSFGSLEQRLLQEVTRLLEEGEPVLIERTGDEYEDRLIGHFNEGSFTTALESRRHFVHTEVPAVLPYYFHVARSAPTTPAVLTWSADNRRTYDVFSVAAAVAGFLQGGEPRLSLDAGVASFDRYRWGIYRVTGEDRPLLADAAFDIYFDRRTRSLLYVKSPCDATDADKYFYLHVVPQGKRNYVVERSKPPTFSHLGFRFGDRIRNGKGVAGGDCVAEVKLPNHAIYSISTGRSTAKGKRFWSKDIFFHERLGDF